MKTEMRDILKSLKMESDRFADNIDDWIETADINMIEDAIESMDDSIYRFLILHGAKKALV